MFNKEQFESMTCINDMNLEDIRALVENNVHFRDKMYEYMYEDAVVRIQEEYLHDFEGRYEFGGCYCTKVHLNASKYSAVNWDRVYEWVEHVERVYGWLWRDMQADALTLAKQARELNDKLYRLDLSDKNAARIEAKIDSIQKILEERIEDAIDLELDSLDDDSYIADEVEFYDFVLEDLYIDSDGNIYTASLNKIA